MTNLIRRLALLLAAAVCLPASAYAADATLACDGTWNWNPDTSTLTCVAATQNGPPSCSNLTPSTTLPDTAFTLAATCSANGGIIDRWEFAGPDATTAFIGTSGTNISGSISGRAAGPYTFYVRASKDAGATWGDWYSRAITFSAVTVTAPTCTSISPTTATTGVARTFSVNCTGVQGGATYAWTSTSGSPTSGNAATHAVTYAAAGNYSLTAQVCNGSACSSTVSQQVTVTNPTTGAISCTNIPGITNTIVYPGQGEVANLTDVYNLQWLTQNSGRFTGHHAIVVAFRTPNEVSNRPGSIGIAEYAGIQAGRLVLIHSQPCATLPNNYMGGSWGTIASAPFTVGMSDGSSTRLEPNTVYYATITNRYKQGSSWPDTCGDKDCPAIIDLKR